jgi:CsoR family transcriptional regulator, copper-sensing transcriptional repressor
MTIASLTSRPQPRSHPDTRHEREIRSRLRKASGQLVGVQAMYENGRYCIDVLDQLSAVTAATDAVALLVLEDHIRACVRDAVEGGNTDQKVDELVTAIRRYVRGRGGRR